MRFCSKLGCCAALAAAALWAGGPAPEATPRIKSVVKTDPRTGKLVRTVIAGAQPAISTTPARPAPPAIDAAVHRIAEEHSLPPELLHSVIQVESDYNPYAVSSKGAMGLMQLIPETARRFGVSDAFDAVDNIQGGARYLKYLLELYKGDYPRALAAYNAGEKAVEKYNGVPPYAETQNYVSQVQKRLSAAARRPAPAEAKPARADVAQAETPGDGPRHIHEVVDADGAVRYVVR
jgi:soluble lytic murein transglycosylase-like protein